MKSAHVFFNVHMALAHKSLAAMFMKKTGSPEPLPGEAALFLNRKMTGVKILVAGNAFVYARQSHTGKPMTLDQILKLPQLLGAPRLTLGNNIRGPVSKAYNSLDS